MGLVCLFLFVVCGGRCVVFFGCCCGVVVVVGFLFVLWCFVVVGFVFSSELPLACRGKKLLPSGLLRLVRQSNAVGG